MKPAASRIHRRCFWGLLAGLPLVFSAMQIDLPARWGGFRGDSAVYLGMASSLSHDFDLEYTREDLIRISKEWPSGPQGILLVASENDPGRIFYAKPPLYAVFTAPLYRLLKTNGVLLFNAACFLLIIWCGFKSFTDPESSVSAMIWTWIFYGLTVVPAYIFTLTPDLFNAALLAAGLMPWVRAIDRPPGTPPEGRYLISITFLSLAAIARPPNALFLFLPLAAMFFDAFRSGNPKHRAILGFIGGIALIAGVAVLFLSVNKLLTGQWFSYSGFRKRIVGHLPFETPDYHFLNTGNEISTRNTRFIFHWSVVWHNAGYFFIGRFAGLIPYFLPAAISLFLAFPLRRKESFGGWMRLLAGVILICLIVFHIVYIPSNYHGGSCAVGNRYAISFLPAFFILLTRPPKVFTILVAGVVTALLSGPVALNPVEAFTRYQDVSKRQALKIFPLEITLLDSWPVDDSLHIRVPYDGYFAYFGDDNQFGKELEGFWVRGRSGTSLILRCWKKTEIIRLRIQNGGAFSRIEGRAGRFRFARKCQPGEEMSFDFDPGPPVLSYNLAGNPSYCYAVDISVSDGFIPKFHEPGSTDGRFLGCFTQIGLSP